MRLDVADRDASGFLVGVDCLRVQRGGSTSQGPFAASRAGPYEVEAAHEGWWQVACAQSPLYGRTRVPASKGWLPGESVTFHDLNLYGVVRGACCCGATVNLACGKGKEVGHRSFRHVWRHLGTAKHRKWVQEAEAYREMGGAPVKGGSSFVLG